ncbi:MAG: molybdate ABC transporter substrate-binding protein [Ardenticatenales bacterium]
MHGRGRSCRAARLVAGAICAAGLAGCAGTTAPSSGSAGAPTTTLTSASAAASSAASPPAAERGLTVLAAASLAEPFAEIGRAFEAANPGVRVAISFAGSQQLATQIGEGAPADVFASANERQMDRVVAAGEADGAAVQTFARNRLVVVTPSDNPGGVAALADLARPGLKLVVAAAGVPVGDYTRAFLVRASALPEFTAAYSPTVLANVVSYEDDVKSVLAKVRLGEADAGIVYTSDAGTGVDVRRIDIPDDLNVIAAYPIAPLAHAKDAALAERFVAAVLGAPAQAALERYGFIPAARP